jgi:hypothetical protein
MKFHLVHSGLHIAVFDQAFKLFRRKVRDANVSYSAGDEEFVHGVPGVDVVVVVFFIVGTLSYRPVH